MAPKLRAATTAAIQANKNKTAVSKGAVLKLAKKRAVRKRTLAKLKPKGQEEMDELGEEELLNKAEFVSEKAESDLLDPDEPESEAALTGA